MDLTSDRVLNSDVDCGGLVSSEIRLVDIFSSSCWITRRCSCSVVLNGPIRSKLTRLNGFEAFGSFGSTVWPVEATIDVFNLVRWRRSHVAVVRILSGDFLERKY